MFVPGIYRSYDIRGIVPDEFNAEEAYHVGRAYAQHTDLPAGRQGAKNVVVARDMRPSGESIMEQLMQGLVDSGVNVIAIGQSTSPMFYFAVHHLQADGGLMVTASHNPAQYNGIKLTRKEAVPIGGESGLLDIRDLVEKRAWQDVETKGSIREESVRKAYVGTVSHGVDAEGLTIVADAGNGMAGLLLPDFFREVGGNAVPLFWELDGTFPNHEADPLKEENRRDAERAVKEHHADFGVMFDGDADRVFFIDELGRTIPGDIATALIAQELLKEKPGSTILYDLRASRSVKEAVEEAGGKALMSKVGHSNIKTQMRTENAVFAGEVSGHFYFTPWYAESALLATGYLIRLVKESGQPLSELVAPLMRYAKTPEVNFEVADKTAVLQKLEETYADAEILKLDGVSIIYPNWWANVRPSNTEPLLRLNMEADTPELLKEKRTEIEAILHAGK